MGLFSFIYHNKELVELEELIPILWDKINSFYNGKIKDNIFHYTENEVNNRYLRQTYGYGNIINPQYNIPDYLEEKINEFMKSEGVEGKGYMIVLKKNDYNYLMMSLAEFAKKSNRYIQLMNKSSLQLSTKMKDIFSTYQNRIEKINHLYKYVVE